MPSEKLRFKRIALYSVKIQLPEDFQDSFIYNNPFFGK